MHIRVEYGKTSAMRLIGHLDLYKTWERLIRRAKLPLEYTLGFNPHPKINLSPALPLGFTSECELIDIWLEESLALDMIDSALRTSAPPGIRLKSVSEVLESEPAIQTQISSAIYEITFLEFVSHLEQKIAALETSSSLPRMRRGKQYDLRPLIEQIEILNHTQGDFQKLKFQLACRDGATGRPDEVLAELEYPFNLAEIKRVEFLYKHGVEADSI
jgi:radical SAM-linked protein